MSCGLGRSALRRTWSASTPNLRAISTRKRTRARCAPQWPSMPRFAMLQSRLCRSNFRAVVGNSPCSWPPLGKRQRIALEGMMADRRSIRAAADEGSGLPGLQDERPTRRDMMLSMAGALGFAALAQVQVAKPPSSEDVPGLVHYTVPPDLAAKYPPIPSWKRELKQLTPNVYAYIQPGGPGIDNHAIANAGVIVRPGDLMAIDALAAPLHTKLFIAEATKATHKNFRRLVNTHPHSDHVFGNQIFDPPIESVA